MEMQKFTFDIDVTGACNLRCPCCPQGNIRNYHLPNGFMEPDLLARIVQKIVSECLVTGINLFNWTEPLLHPKIHKLVRIVQNADIPCHLSSNLKLLPDADAIMAANPASFKISTSGFTQEVYGLSHRGGDIEQVKNHMIKLAEAKKRNNASTRIFVNYHRYRNNLKEEALMRDFAVSLGFEFEPAWALMFPLEKILACADEAIQDFPLSDEDHLLIDRLAMPLKKTLDAAQKHRNQPCSLRDAQISMDFRGNVMLCCGIFNADKYIIGNYLDMPIDEIQRIRQNHQMCGICMRHGGHMYLTYRVPEMDELILKNITLEDVVLLDLHREFAQKSRQQFLQRVFQKYLSRFISKKRKDALKNLIK
jgi:MoaA/NifB/PqqE/SkfB family radical SAM enzyme